ncbi:MAG: ATP-grasp domain-containing protein, partial [Gammaproteobacteria bacterium]|nr:ATP-grasp domain-containing protein [Gammaproteobacteria bacterium]MBT4862560.1 ATP-grasp domain-containing protein [Gammaproteobacteria bacterium]
MFLIDKPYVSEFFKKTVKDFNIPIVDTESAKKFTLYEGTSLVNEDTAIKQYKNNPNTSIYTISENSIGWISQHLSHNDLPDKIDLFKDKFKF